MVRMTIGRRLTLWYGAIWTLSLCVLATSLYFTFAHNLRAEIDRALDEELVEIEMEVRGASDPETRAAQFRKYFGQHPFYAIQVARPDGTVLFTSDLLGADRLAVPSSVPDGKGMAVENVVLADGRQFRAASRLVQSNDGLFIIQAADSLELYHGELAQLVSVLLWLMPASILVALAVGSWLSRRALAPVDRLTTAAVQISATCLEDRVSVPDADDELGRLAAAFNDMLDRLQRSFLEMQHLTADAAHELRTPLAVLRNEADVALRASRSGDEYRAVLENQIEEIERMTRLVDQLLFLSREDAGVPTAAAPISVGGFVEELVNDLQPLAVDRGLTMVCSPLPNCQVAIEPDRLRRLFCNVLDNALKYTPSGGNVSVTGACRTDSIEIVVADSGVGVSPEVVPRLFQRFYRGAMARGSTSGSGLGLAICQAIVTRHGGQIAIESQVGRGTRVKVSLPSAAAT
ncbi:MAG: HAMP domain-containing protein [Planctomycetaceae bacterium]|nr:HAMP domain-containing protein [Planctomycetaceae bacterium]